jgi:hypothetical protein
MNMVFNLERNLQINSFFYTFAIKFKINLNAGFRSLSD